MPGPPVQHDGAQLQALLTAHPLAGAIPLGRALPLAGARFGEGHELIPGDRQGQADPGIAPLAVGRGNRQGFATHQGIAGVQQGAPPTAHQKTMAAASSGEGHPLRVGQADQSGGHSCFWGCCFWG